MWGAAVVMPAAPCFLSQNCFSFTLRRCCPPQPAPLCYNPGMKWPQWYPTRADVMGILFVVALLCFFAAAAVLGPQQRTNATNAGFGPDWDCTVVPQGGPICIKKPKLGH